jgi:hypothetical protein
MRTQKRSPLGLPINHQSYKSFTPAPDERMDLMSAIENESSAIRKLAVHFQVLQIRQFTH